MANKKATTTTRKVQEAVVEPDIDLEDEVIERDIRETVDSKEMSANVKKKFADNDYVMCRSLTAGGLYINCRSRNYYEFRNYGDQCEIEYRDLVELVRKHSDHIFLPRIIVEDEDFVAEFPQLKKLYASMYTTSDLREILLLPANKIRKAVQKIPAESLGTMRSLAASMISNGEIDSVSAIRELSDIFGADYNLLSELFSNK